MDNQPGGNTYDGNGNPTTYGSAKLTFDAQNRLTTLGSGSKFSAGYRADGLRAWKSGLQRGSLPPVNSNAAKRSANTSQVIVYTPPKTYFVYDGDSIIAELDPNGNATAVNTWGATGLLSRQNITAGTSSVYTYDPSGNVEQRLDGSSGAVKGSYAFDAFGKEATNDTAPDPYQYGAKWGYYTDSETGLMLCGHRYYDSGTGRWLTRDPIGYDGGINLYGYVGNTGVNGIDPSGLNISVIGPEGVEAAEWVAEDAGPLGWDTTSQAVTPKPLPGPGPLPLPPTVVPPAPPKPDEECEIGTRWLRIVSDTEASLINQSGGAVPSLGRNPYYGRDGSRVFDPSALDYMKGYAAFDKAGDYKNLVSFCVDSNYNPQNNSADWTADNGARKPTTEWNIRVSTFNWHLLGRPSIGAL